MEFFDIVKDRYSVRKFRSNPVCKEHRKIILDVARRAPSAGRIKGYKICSVTDLEIRKKLVAVAGCQEFVAEAPLVLVFCADKEKYKPRYGSRGMNLYAIQDTTIAAAYAQLAVTALGLSSCWVGAFFEGQVKKIIGTKLRPIAMLAIGYEAEGYIYD